MRRTSERIIDLLGELEQECEKDGWVLEFTLCDSEQYDFDRRSGFLWLFHLCAGLYLGIPLCCIWYFLRHYNELEAINRRRGDLPMGYVKCDKCYRRQAVVK